MPTAPNTLAVANAIKGFLQSAQVTGNPAYANVILGGLKDYTDQLPVGVVIASQGSVERYTLGRNAKIHDKPRFEISSVVDYSDASVAEQQIYAIRDAVTFLFAQSATLNLPGQGVILSQIVPNSERYSFLMTNGQRWRSHSFSLEVTYEYTLPLGALP